MAMLSPATSSRILIAGLGIASVAVLGFMRYMLILYRDSVELEKPNPKTRYINQDTEDALKPSTLEKLVQSHNYAIRETASRIVGERALHDGATLNALLWEVTRPDHDRREQAIRALYMLSGLPGLAELNKPEVYSAIVTSLSYSLTDVPHEKYDKDFDNFEFRDVAERLCLLLLYRLIAEFGPDGVIKAGFVQKWLAKEPWGTTEKERMANFIDLYRKNTRLSQIIVRIRGNPRGLDQLIKARLFPAISEILGGSGGSGLAAGQGIFDEDGISLSYLEGGPRIREHSTVERHRRRRHREAMVLNDGVQPIGVGDIIERDYDSPTEERTFMGEITERDYESPVEG